MNMLQLIGTGPQRRSEGEISDPFPLDKVQQMLIKLAMSL